MAAYDSKNNITVSGRTIYNRTLDRLRSYDLAGFMNYTKDIFVYGTGLAFILIAKVDIDGFGKTGLAAGYIATGPGLVSFNW